MIIQAADNNIEDDFNLKELFLHNDVNDSGNDNDADDDSYKFAKLLCCFSGGSSGSANVR